MNAIKTFSALLLLSACTYGCADGSKTGTDQRSANTETDVAKNLPGRKKSARPVTRDEVLTPRGGDESAEPADYSATESAFRLYGVEPGDGVLPASATIAEVGVWQTRNYKVGDSIGRGLVVTKIDESGVTLHGARADVTMAIGADVDLRVIRHDHDVAAQPLGRHRFVVNPLAARAALETAPARPAAEEVTLYEMSMLKLGAVDPAGLWAAADFREGDLISAVDGAAPTLDAIETGLTDDRALLEVTVYRGGVDLQRRYETDPAR
ncbi:MAG: hypothetical protein KIT84_39065 [Labilithrix sp.]|nr:hypothetical protein [Labilithrix sp.]MCW5817063.1 hypothetical protein [Labilithrix sp.]